MSAFTIREDVKNSESMSAYSCQRSCDISRTNKIVRSSCLNNSGSFVSSDGFSICSAASNKSIESNSVLLSDYIIPQQQFRGGTSVLDPKSSDFQWVLTDSSSKMIIRTDASKKSWGAVCQAILTGGEWHSNFI